MHMCPPIEPPSHTPTPSHPSGFRCPVSCIELGLVIYFTYGNIHVSLLFSQIIPPLPSHTESKSLFFISVSETGQPSECFSVYVNIVFFLWGSGPMSATAGSQRSPVFSFIGKCWSIFQSACTISRSHQQCLSDSGSASSPAFDVITFWVFFFDCTVQLMGSQFPEQGLNLCSLHQKHRVLTTGLNQWRSPHYFLFQPF